ncbi:MAG: ShlB/FhaC/HecB family hemolysin secretion/activation protein, partial [Betaproteobacteria bacterium]|nr:ShlB/FhaC/HecB family hemolysin secretion/activation protein [Betaproteobacteria bacterium]
MPTDARPQSPRWAKTLLIALCAVSCALPAAARAQAPTPGAVQDTLGPKKPPPKAPPAQFVFPSPPPPVAHDPKDRRFTVNAFTFVGNTVYTGRQLKQLTERYMDLQLNLHDLTRAADVVTRFYRDNGYVFAHAVVPAQRVEKGIVRIEVIEGRVGQVRFEGNRRYSPQFLRQRLTRLVSGSLITSDNLEHDLLVLNDLPGVTARAVLEAGKQFGTSDILIRVEEKIASLLLRPNNHGRREIGRWRIDGGVSFNNPLGLLGDQLSYYAIHSQDNLLRYGRLSYSLPVGRYGTRLELGYSKSDYEIAGDLAALGVEGDARNADISLTHPYLRTRSQNLSFNLGLRQTKLRQRALGVETSSTSINLLNAGLTYSQIGEDAAVTNAGAQLFTNFKGNPLGARQDAQPLKLELEASHLRGIARNWDLYVRGQYVYSPDPLADSEKVAFGGPGSVRGYRPSEVRGDGGVLFTTELRHPINIANTLGILSFFYDVGVARFEGTPGFVDGTLTIQSVGSGVTFYLL